MISFKLNYDCAGIMLESCFFFQKLIKALKGNRFDFHFDNEIIKKEGLS